MERTNLSKPSEFAEANSLRRWASVTLDIAMSVAYHTARSRPYVTLSVVLRETIDVEGPLACGEDLLLRAVSGFDIGLTNCRPLEIGIEAAVRSRIVRRKLGSERILL